MKLTDTIAAISTPIGEGGISVIRLSGDHALSVIEKIYFKDKDQNKKFSISETDSHTVHFGYIFDDTQLLIDEVLITIFKNPHSYTGEDVIEISSHGGTYIAQKIQKFLKTLFNISSLVTSPVISPR